MFPLVVAGLLLLGFGWFFLQPVFRRIRRKKIIRQPFSEAWLEIIYRNLPVYKHLPADLQKQLCAGVQIFLAEKHFEGKLGIEITDEIRVTVAVQACLLILNRKTDYFPYLHTI